MFRENKQVIVLFFVYFLSFVMGLYYFFADLAGKQLYFIKEYLLLISFFYTLYFFTTEASTLLTNSKTLSRAVNINKVSAGLAICLTLADLIYEIQTTGSHALNCDHGVWVTTRSFGFILSAEFVFLGIIVTQKINSIKDQMNSEELEKRVFSLWLFISAVFVSCSIKISISVNMKINSISNCFLISGRNDAWNAVAFVIITLTTDYFILFCVLWLFFTRGRPIKPIIDASPGLYYDEVDILVTLEDKSRVAKESDFNDYILYPS